MHRKVAGALVVALALALAGCGGSSTLSKADFAKQASAACTTARKDSEKTKAKGIAAFVDKIEAYQRNKLKGIEALKPPDELKTAYAEYKDALTQRADLINRLGTIVKARHRVSKQDEKTVAALQVKEEKAATELGATACRENQSTSGH
jgi:GTP1/Obg family GTP-binding protein